MGKVKCADCGFLTFLPSGTSQYIETPASCRNDGRVPVFVGTNGIQAGVDKSPHCYVNSCAINVEWSEKVAAHAAHNSNRALAEEQARLAVIKDTERDCGSRGTFIDYQPECSPKEHRQMLLNAQMLKQQQEFQAEQRILADGRYTDELGRSATRHTETLAILQSQTKWNAIAVIGASLIAGAFTLIGSQMGANRQTPPEKSVKTTPQLPAIVEPQQPAKAPADSPKP